MAKSVGEAFLFGERERRERFAGSFNSSSRLSSDAIEAETSLEATLVGVKEDEAMVLFNKGWEDKHKKWQHHLGFARTGW